MIGYSNIHKKEFVFTKENRLNTRYEYNHEFKMESINLKKVDLEAQMIDISMGGIGFISAVNLINNDMLEIAFQYNKITIPAIIKVQHVNLYDLGFFIGGQFVALQDSYRRILSDLY